MGSVSNRPDIDPRRGRLRAAAVMAGLLLLLLIAMFAAGNVTNAINTTPTPTPFAFPTPTTTPPKPSPTVHKTKIPHARKTAVPTPTR